MKKNYIFCITVLIICIYSFKSNAAIISISVEDFKFVPSDLTITIGDTIMWTWSNSSGLQTATSAHTTTSTDIPLGTAAWNEQINSNSPSFMYVPAVLGSYNYICTIHFSMGMVGHFTVIGSTGITTSLSAVLLTLNSVNPVTQELKLTYSIPKEMPLNIKMYNVIGNSMFTFVSSNQNAGIHTETFSIPNLSEGIYIIALESKDAILYKKIFVQ